MTKQRIELVHVIRRFSNQPHQLAALNMLQAALPDELLDPKSDWVDCWYADGSGWEETGYNR